jgi:tetratricopeptide (TPR) repeat protein
MSDKIQILFEKANTALELGKLEIAQKYFSEVIALDQTASGAWCGIALCLRPQERFEEAEEYFLKGLKHEPNHIQILVNLIHFYTFCIPNRAKALEMSQKAFEIAPWYWPVYYHTAQLHREFRTPNYEEKAANYVDTAIKLSPNNSALFSLKGDLLSKDIKTYASAREYYLKALEIDPESETTHTNYGILLLSLYRPHEAKEHFEFAQRINPKTEYLENNIMIADRHSTKFIPKVFKFLRVSPDFLSTRFGRFVHWLINKTQKYPLVMSFLIVIVLYSIYFCIALTFNSKPFPLNRIPQSSETLDYKSYKPNTDIINKSKTLPPIEPLKPIKPIDIKPSNIACDDKTKTCHIKQ